MRMMIAAAVGAAVVALSAGCQNFPAASSAAPAAASGAARSAVPAAVKWSGTLFAFRAGSDNHVTADPGTFAPGPDPGRVWSADGAFVARKDKSTVTIARADGTVVRTVDYKPDWAECEGWLPQTLSADGRYLTAGYAAWDPSGMLSVERLVDTTTGKEVVLAVPKPERLYFRADGSMIVVSGSTGYVVQDGAIVAEQQLAADGLTILGYSA